MNSHRLNNTTHETTFTYRDVSFGYYLVEVSAQNNEGLWSLTSTEEPITLESEEGMWHWGYLIE
jgi:hypothetical protein